MSAIGGNAAVAQAGFSARSVAMRLRRVLARGSGRRAAIGLGALFCAACSAPAPGAAPASVVVGAIPGAAGVAVRVAGPVERTVQSDADGRFRVAGLPAGTYRVTPVQPGFVFEPVERSVTLGASVDTLRFRRIVPGEGVSQAVLGSIDTLPPGGPPADEVVLPNGQRLSDYVQSRGIEVDSGRTP